MEMGLEGGDDPAVVHNILNEFQFLMSTLEIFGLPKNYADGEGHHSNWREKGSEDKKKGKKGKAKKKQSAAAIKLMKSRGL